MKFLADENFNNLILRGVQRRVPEAEIIRVQDTELYEASDPELLAWATEYEYFILSHDENTLIGYFYERIAQNLTVYGLFIAHEKTPVGEIVDSLVVIIKASSADEWVGRIHYLPF